MKTASREALRFIFITIEVLPDKTDLVKCPQICLVPLASPSIIDTHFQCFVLIGICGVLHLRPVYRTLRRVSSFKPSTCSTQKLIFAQSLLLLLFLFVAVFAAFEILHLSPLVSFPLLLLATLLACLLYDCMWHYVPPTEQQ